MTRLTSILLGAAIAVAGFGAPALALEPDLRASEVRAPDGRAPDVRATDPRPGVKRVCLSAAETREEIKARKLVESFAALKSAQAQYKGEPVSARLCRMGEEYIYEIALLHRDGRYTHVVMNAVSGKWIEARHGHELTPKP